MGACGYEHIPQRHATRFNTFCVEYLNPFLNFHRPCLFSTDKPDPKKPRRIKRVYRAKDAMTPLDKLASLPDAGEIPAPRHHARAPAPARARAQCHAPRHPALHPTPRSFSASIKRAVWPANFASSWHEPSLMWADAGLM